MNCVFAYVKEKRWFVSTQSGGTGFNPGLKFSGKNDQRPSRKTNNVFFKLVFSFFFEIAVLFS